MEAPALIGPARQNLDALCTSTEGAIRLKQSATMRRALGHSAEAEEMEAAAAAFLDVGHHVTGPVRTGNGGEVIVATSEALAHIPGVIDTVRERPDMLAATASRARLELVEAKGDALALAVDTAESIQPRNSIEKMLAHELASCHRMAMLFANQATALVERFAFDRGTGLRRDIDSSLSVEACRLLNASTKAMAAFQDGMVMLDRVRRGGRQTVKVIHQHVAVGAGGQAVVAGTVKGGKRLAGITGGHTGANRPRGARGNGR